MFCFRKINPALVILLFVLFGCGLLIDNSYITNEGVIKGPNRGEGGNDNDQTFRSLAVSNMDPNVVYVGTEGNGIFKSLDGGVTWQWIRSGMYYDRNAQGYPEIYSLAVAPNDNSAVYVASTGGYGPSDGSISPGGFYKTLTGGALWQRKYLGQNNSAFTAIAVDPNNPGIIYLATSGGDGTRGGDTGNYYPSGMFKSTNSGESWAALNLPSPQTTSFIWQIKAWDSNNIFALGKENRVGPGFGLIKSVDGGTTWSTITAPGTFEPVWFDVAPQDKNIIYLTLPGSAESRLQKSSDGGDSWKGIYESRRFSDNIFVSPSSSEVVFAIASNTLLKLDNTTDTTTTVLSSEAPIQQVVFAPSDPNIVYAAGAHYNIFKSADGGNTFTKLISLRDYIDSH